MSQQNAMWLAIAFLAIAVLFLRLSLVRLGAAVERYRECSIKATQTWIEAIRQTTTLDLARFERLPAETLGREEAIAQCRGLLDTLARMSGVALLLLATSCAESGRDLLVAPVGTPDAPDFVNVQPSTVEVCCVDQQKLWDIVAKSIAELASQRETRRERLYLIQDNDNTCCGRFLLFWRKGGGYTSSLDSAARYTATQALAAVRDGEAAFWPLDELRDRSTPCVDQERVEFGADRVPSLRRSDLVAIVDGPHAGGEPPEVASELRPSLFELTGLAGELPVNGADS